MWAGARCTYLTVFKVKQEVPLNAYVVIQYTEV
jgi:hypothetical protein